MRAKPREVPEGLWERNRAAVAQESRAVCGSRLHELARCGDLRHPVLRSGQKPVPVPAVGKPPRAKPRRVRTLRTF
jgi:hypothetical protein